MSDRSRNELELGGDEPIPDLELDLPPRAAPAPPAAGPPAAELASPSSRAQKPAAPPASVPDDGFEMGSGLDLDLAGNHAAQSRSLKPRGPRAAATGGAGFGHVVEEAGAEYEEEEEDEPVPVWSRILGVLAFAVVACPVLFALLHFVHRPPGWGVTGVLKPALDGSSNIASGVVALIALAISLGLGLRGFTVRGPAYTLLVSAAGCLLFAIVMITVTFSIEGGASPVVPESSALAPYPLCSIPLGMGLRAVVLAWRAWAGGAKGKLAAIGWVVVSCAMLFASLELLVGVVPGLRFAPVPLSVIGL